MNEDRMDLARQLFRAAHPDPEAGRPFHRRNQLDDLWPCDQEEYLRMADAALKARLANPTPA